MKIGIIGGGISGMVASINLKDNNNEVVIIEKNSKCGKKLLMSGNGRCNFWNSNQDESRYDTTNRELIDKIINPETEEESISFLCDLGLVSTIKDGYYYPMSNQASTVHDLLIHEINKLGIKINYEEEVVDIIKEEKFKVITNKSTYIFDKVILSTGSKSYPKTGSDGFGYKILEKFNHNIVKPLPALTGLLTDKKYNWHGIRCDVKLMLKENDQIIGFENGEIQLTDYGVSGICIFNLSLLVSKGLDLGKKEEIIIDFIPFLETIEMARDWFTDRTIKTGRSVNELVSGILNNKLYPILVNEDKLFTDLSKIEQDKILNNLINFKVNIVGIKGFDEAQVCIGGVKLTDINLNTMESKKVNGLYIIGELLDLTGVCGGYNIGIALRTALKVKI